jgi:hypothetical protein
MMIYEQTTTFYRFSKHEDQVEEKRGERENTSSHYQQQRGQKSIV